MTRRDCIVEYIQDFWDRNGYAPSFREIAECVGLHTINTVGYHLRALRDEGRVVFVDGLARTVRVVSP